MTGAERDGWERELAELDGDLDRVARYEELRAAGMHPEQAAELADELGDPAAAPRGCAIGCVCLVALLIVLAAVVGAVVVVLGE